jgi:CRISPR-associated protein (TIGR03986 family)
MTPEDFLQAGRAKPPRRAPYNFVRLNEVVLPSPVGAHPDHGRPVADHLCGELEVLWEVETPLLVGGTANSEPCRVGAGGRYVIPGASLRGLIRAALEIAAYGRLNFVDDGRFGLRDFEHVSWSDVVGDVRRIRAGWLTKSRERGTLREVQWGRIEITELCRALQETEPNMTCTEWQRGSLAKRRAWLEAAGLAGPVELVSMPLKETDTVDRRPRYSLAKLHSRRQSDAVPGHLVVAGAAERDEEQESNKKTEVVFLHQVKDTIQLDAATMARFIEIQVVDGNQHQGAPEANWSYWQPKFEAGLPVPVFFCGPANGPPAAIALSRLMRVPFKHTVRELRERSQKPADPPGADLDFVEALFGWVPEQGVDKPDRAPREQAWRGRVFFRHAELADEVAPEDLVTRNGVTMQPRASFYPYYLRPADGAQARHPVDWSNDKARLAGRKRYPARNRAAEKEDFVRAPQAARREEQECRLSFLPATPTQPLRFVSRIRFHNVHPAELGGLVFALTFGQHGQADQGYRHMLGRAKGYGFGQLRVSVATVRRLERNDGQDAPDLAGCLRDFQGWALEQLRARGVAAARYEALPEIAELLAMAHAPTGARLAGALRFPSKGAPTDAEQILKAYQHIKKATGTKQGRNFRLDGQDHSGFGGALASDDPATGAFWSLPRYPPARR